MISKEQLLGMVRHTLTFFGGMLVTKGLLDDATLFEITGAIITITGAVWSIIEKNK